MAAAWCLRWGLSRAGTWLLPPPTRCSRQALHKQVDGTEFQSIYSLDKLYPESKGPDTAWRVPDGAQQAGSDIPLVNSKAEVRFHLATADWIAEPVRQKIAITHKNKINRSGELILTSESSRYQFRNLADCLQKIRDMIAEASQVPKEPSKEDAQLKRLRQKAVRDRRGAISVCTHRAAPGGRRMEPARERIPVELALRGDRVA
ncbi:Peptidyl-tRNA hydrolase ICT1, mitochondrial [Tupaia chinensis]|uniref:Peptidyl-tRNA hydrolase ICT1, mitochondrial n=1 Tax=Tupaia chinensis TaxID=246437 RepID=L9L0P0_TUPCH|nr:Peptidyl-tRNA hydrolase ICT1, mitochondrial [Tupaia chinensis]